MLPKSVGVCGDWLPRADRTLQPPAGPGDATARSFLRWSPHPSGCYCRARGSNEATLLQLKKYSLAGAGCTIAVARARRSRSWASASLQGLSVVWIAEQLIRMRLDPDSISSLMACWRSRILRSRACRQWPRQVCGGLLTSRDSLNCLLPVCGWPPGDGAARDSRPFSACRVIVLRIAGSVSLCGAPAGQHGYRPTAAIVTSSWAGRSRQVFGALRGPRPYRVS